MKKAILKIDGIFLSVMGTIAGINDLAGYFFGKGAFGKIYYNNTIAIGGFEAHCLAAILGLIFLLKSNRASTSFYNITGIAAHLALGCSNLIWFKVFYETETLSMGYLTTFAHFAFVVLHLIAIRKSSKPITQANFQ